MVLQLLSQPLLSAYKVEVSLKLLRPSISIALEVRLFLVFLWLGLEF